jgi:uncharacterized protein (TIGR02117 family)
LKLFYINSVWSALRALIGWPFLVLGLYCIAALFGSLIPVNRAWVSPANGTTLYLHDNGIHTSIIIPCAPADAANACLFPINSDSDIVTRWQMIGWGDREFYLNTPTWRDLDLGTAAAAFVGTGKSLVHVDNLTVLPHAGIKAIKVDDATLGKILSGIYRSATTNAYTGSKRTPIIGYGRHDIFYEGSLSRVRNYSILYTCNNWVSEILANAGVKTGYWTPLPFGVMWWH